MSLAGRIRTISETLTVIRGGSDKYGNPNKQPHGTIQGLIGWGTSRGAFFKDLRGESNKISATLFVRKGTDVQVRDRIVRKNGQKFIVGPVMWDEPEPFGGDPFLDEDVVHLLESDNG
ncbi:hypothetical protein P5W11_06485 [Mycobacteroides abscessus subsp. bolletii]|uniref:hypothetical protein n=1 Tax=Mycobacteroides abscessus TaxID=36809 RepID=UPI0009CD725B|nr:hypothetical protein [Mycobacteroides abscessus]MDO3067868.1 hypothetical protein [Mycobacteroides abscessus subsp. bolletii]SLD44583.1 Uncharacterised protein [Mycobacteroides abscessus subsp. bolletii]